MTQDLGLKVVFGPTPDSYLVMYGRLWVHSGMPESLVNTLEQPGVNPLTVAWIAMHPGNELWVLRTALTNTLWYAPSTPDYFQETIAGVAGDHATTLSFTADGAGYFMRRAQSGPLLELDASPAYARLDLAAARREVPDFDARLRTVLFGREGTHVFVLDRGFVAHLQGAAKSPAHPLYQACAEFAGIPECTILDGSVLSAHDDEHFLLRVQVGDDVHTRANFSDEMRARVQELIQLAQEPEEQAAIEALVAEETNNMAMQLMAAQAEMNQRAMLTQARIQSQMQHTQAMASLMTRGARMVTDTLTGSHTTYEWKWR